MVNEKGCTPSKGRLIQCIGTFSALVLQSRLSSAKSSLHSPPSPMTYSFCTWRSSLSATLMSSIGESFTPIRVHLHRRESMCGSRSGSQSDMLTSLRPVVLRRAGSAYMKSKCSAFERCSTLSAFTTVMRQSSPHTRLKLRSASRQSSRLRSMYVTLRRP